MICLCLLLLVSQLDIDYPDAPAAWPLGPSVAPRRGYGQWNDYSEFHRALDFHGVVGDPVFAPYPNEGGFWVLGVAQDTIIVNNIAGSALIGTGKYATYGWHYGHIDINNPLYPLQDSTFFSRNIISLLVSIPGLGSHVHFSWLGVDAYAPGDPHPQMGYFNPFEYLSVPISFPPYDEAVFGPTDGGEYNVFESIRGIVFATEGNNYICPPQDRIHDVVDIIVRPYTYYFQNPANDSCTVRVVMWRLLKQNYNTLGYYPYSILGSWRTLFNFSGYIPDDNDINKYYDEYRKVYFGGCEHWSNNICLTNTCDSVREDASFPGVSTVWVNDYNRVSDFNDTAYCRGGWDTRLSLEFEGDPANTDESAAFPDGRYAIEVLAIPQKSKTRERITLPVDDITSASPEVTGVIVDNWVPRILKLRLQDTSVQIIRYGVYYENVPNNPFEGRYFGNGDPGYYVYPYICTGDSTNEYSLHITYSEPVTDLIQSIPLSIKMVTGPDSSKITNWESEIILELNEAYMNPDGIYTSASYHGTGDQPSDYLGNQVVEIEIRSNFACDLAGHPIDADATTIVPALGECLDISNFEKVYKLTEENTFFSGYYRVEGDQEDRSNSIYLIYDYIFDPQYDDEYIPAKHFITLTGSLSSAELFYEVNDHLGTGWTSSCFIYGGTWMCDNLDNVLHVYIVDYLGDIVYHDCFYDPGSAEITSEICYSEITSPVISTGNWERDRYGWLAWKTISEQEDGLTARTTTDYELYDVELFVSVYDAYNPGSPVTTKVGEGHAWTAPAPTRGPWTWYATDCELQPYGNNGQVNAIVFEYTYPDIVPDTTIIPLDPPGIGIATNSESICSQDLETQVNELHNYLSAFPNPANGSVSIEFMLAGDFASTVRIYDISGHLVNTIAEELPGMQTHTIRWNLKDASGNTVPAGIYYISLVADSFTDTRTIVVIQ